MRVKGAELADATRARLIKRAHDLDASLVEMHSHPGRWDAAFSPSDLHGLSETVPHMWWRLNKRPYAAIVIAPSGFDALVWLDGPRSAQALDSLAAGSQILRPTNITIIGARIIDPVPGTLKVALIDRLIRETNAEVESNPVAKSLLSTEAFDAIRASDWVFGCLDDDGPRAVLNELCAAYGLPYIDLATDVPTDRVYGGRVCVAIDGQGCLDCLGLLDKRDVRRYFESEEQRDREDAVYGIDRKATAST